MARVSAIDELRRSTRGSHLHLERSVPILRADVTPEELRAYLSRTLGFYEPIEEALATQLSGAVGLDYAPRRKVALLARDLEHLGLDAAAIEALPRCRALPHLPALPEALGCAYVLEGATRGGRVLARHLAEVLGLTRERGASFLLPYGEATDAMWDSFVARLEIALADDPGRRRAVGAAEDTFTRLRRWIEEA